jgi:formate dehydrogenase major subunit
MQGLNRRDFLKLLGLGTAGVLGFPVAGSASELPSVAFGYHRLVAAKETRSICAYCGCGCGLIVFSKGNRVIYTEGDPDHPINEGALCPKGTSISDANTIVDDGKNRVANSRRVSKVLYRAPGGTDWQVKDWDWAIEEIAKRVKATRDNNFEEKDAKGVTVNRTQAIAHLGSASLDNEENYVIHKLLRSLGVINIDHHARL